MVFVLKKYKLLFLFLPSPNHPSSSFPSPFRSTTRPTSAWSSKPNRPNPSHLHPSLSYRRAGPTCGRHPLPRAPYLPYRAARAPAPRPPSIFTPP